MEIIQNLQLMLTELVEVDLLDIIGSNTDLAVNSSHPENYDYDAHLAAGTSDHSTHCAGTVAGNTQGWARDANIYNLDVFGANSGNVDLNGTEAFQYIKEFHNNKPVNPVTGRRNPTIVNNSWSVLSEYLMCNTYVSVASTGRPVEQVQWQGTTYDGPFTIDQLESYGIMKLRILVVHTVKELLPLVSKCKYDSSSTRND